MKRMKRKRRRMRRRSKKKKKRQQPHRRERRVHKEGEVRDREIMKHGFANLEEEDRSLQEHSEEEALLQLPEVARLVKWLDLPKKK
jgi:hypothetical protein